MCDFKYDIVSRCLVAYQKTKNHLHLPTSTWDVWHPSIEQPFFLLHHTLRDFPVFSFSSHLIFWRAGLDLWRPLPNAPFTSQPSDTWHRSPAIPHQLLLTDVTLTTLLLNSVFLQLHLIFHPLTTSSMKGIWDHLWSWLSSYTDRYLLLLRLLQSSCHHPGLKHEGSRPVCLWLPSTQSPGAYHWHSWLQLVPRWWWLQATSGPGTSPLWCCSFTRPQLRILPSCSAATSK